MQEKEKQQMTEEELQRTQVLNIDDFKQTARYEKISSKKPAAFIAILGVIAILIGGSYPVIQSQMSKQKEDNTKSTIQTRKKEDTIKSELTCTLVSPNEANGLDKTMTIKYTFNNEKLIAFTKTLDLKVTTGSAIGPNSLQGYLTALDPYLIKKNGYEVTVKKLDNEVITTTEVDYNKLDVNSIPEANQSNSNYSVQYVVNTSKEAIKQDMEKQKYTCK